MSGAVLKEYEVVLCCLELFGTVWSCLEAVYLEAACVETVRSRAGLAVAMACTHRAWSARTPFQAAQSRRGDRSCAHVHVHAQVGSLRMSDLVRSGVCMCASACACACSCACAFRSLVADGQVCVRRSFFHRRACSAPAPRQLRNTSAPTKHRIRRHARIRPTTAEG